jgi:hypothetical protein
MGITLSIMFLCFCFQLAVAVFESMNIVLRVVVRIVRSETALADFSS